MQVIFSQFSGLVGLMMFLVQLWRGASLDKAIFAAAGAAIAIYLILLVGDILIRRIITYPAPALANGSPRASASKTEHKTETQAQPAQRAFTPEAEEVGV
jgi:hypothetical protein